MIDKDKGILIAKIIVGIIGLIFLFAVIVPRWQKIDDAFNDNVRNFIGLIFNTGASFKKSSDKVEHKYLGVDFDDSKNIFIKQFMNIRTADEIEKTLNMGQGLLDIAPKKVEIARCMAFLYYINNDYEKAEESYQIVLKNYPKGRRSFKNLKTEDSRAIKRTLVELAALAYEQGDTDRMLDYYKQYLRASHRDDVFRELTAEGIDVQTARYEIFSAIAGDGFLSYEKAIKQLEEFSREYPEHVDVFYQLGLFNFEVVNLYAQEDFVSIQQNFYDAQKYFYMALDKIDEFRKKTITINLEKLNKIKNKYDFEKAEAMKIKQRAK